MRNLTKYILGSMVMGACVLSSCDNAEYDELRNQAYILQTGTNANSAEKMTVGTEAVATSINVRLSDVAAETSSYRLVYDAEALNEYNKRNETTYEALPQSSFSLSDTEVTVEAGSSVSTPVTLTVNPLTQEMKDSGKKYAVAFRLESADGKTNVMKSGSVMVYIVDLVIIQPVVVLNTGHYVQNEMSETYPLTEWTVEFNINKAILGTAVGEYNNQALFSASPDEIYIRFGDAPIEGNRLQIKTQGTQMNSQMLFNANTWYHIAFVCTGSKLYLYVNGQLDNSMDMPGKTTNVNSYTLCSNSYYTKGDAMFSEYRLWSKARTQKELQNNMYVCDPTTEGLIFYYKFNEGSGFNFRDSSKNGYHTTTVGESMPTWVQDVRIDGK